MRAAWKTHIALNNRSYYDTNTGSRDTISNTCSSRNEMKRWHASSKSNPPELCRYLPAVIWGVLVECVNWTCPLNPLENWFRHLGGETTTAYAKGFIEYYVSQVIQPENLTRSFQITVGLAALAVNLLIYSYILFRSRRAA